LSTIAFTPHFKAHSRGPGLVLSYHLNAQVGKLGSIHGIEKKPVVIE
jgi:hypothetical protein